MPQLLHSWWNKSLWGPGVRGWAPLCTAVADQTMQSVSAEFSSLSYFPLPCWYFMRSPPKQTICTQICVSVSASGASQTETVVNRIPIRQWLLLLEANAWEAQDDFIRDDGESIAMGSPECLNNMGGSRG